MTQSIFRALTQSIVYENPWMRVREDRILRPNGHEGLYGVVEKSDFAVVAAIEADSITLVRQYRYPVDQTFWELPQGASSTGERDLEKVARAELREEAGLSAKHMELLGNLYPAYGYAALSFNLYVARGLEFVGAQPEPEEYGMESRTFPISEYVRMVRDNEIKDAPTVAACCLLALHGHISLK